MSMHVAPWDWVIWVAGIAGLVALNATVLIRRAYRIFPWFSVLSLYLLVHNLAMLVTFREFGYRIYFYSYWGSGLLESLIHIPVMIEIGRYSLRPKWLLPRWTGTFFFGSLITCFTTALALSQHSDIGDDLILMCQRASWVVYFTQSLMFTILVAYRGALCFSTSQLTFRLLAPIAAISIVGLATQSLRMNSTYTLNHILTQLPNIAWIAGFGFWTLAIAQGFAHGKHALTGQFNSSPRDFRSLLTNNEPAERE